MLELIFVRHGEVDSNVKRAYLGQKEAPLNALGKRQIAHAAQLFANEKIEAIYSSPLSRALETAKAINKFHHIEIQEAFELTARDFGVWDDLTKEEIAGSYPKEFAAWREDPVNFEIPRGESARQMYIRNANFINKLAGEHMGGKIILVSHLNCIRNGLAFLLGLGLEGVWSFELRNGGASRVEIAGQKAVLTSLNEV
jgi:broad specificity phosphatase PhoE